MRWAHREHDRAPAGLPLTSMIDVFFLLLVYFVVQVRFVSAESQLQSDLRAQEESGGGGEVSRLQPQVIRVELDEAGVVFRVGGREARTRERLAAILADLPKEAGVFVRAQARVPWGDTTAAHQACRDAGFTRVTHVPIAKEQGG